MARDLRLLDNESGIVEVTSRTQHGRYLLRPSPEVNDLVLGILGRAQTKYEVILYAFIFLSNHFHLLMKANSVSQMALFVGFLKANMAKELGRLHDWRERFWGRRYHSAPVADSEAAQISRFLYILSNGCKEGLVASPLEWPGVGSAAALYHGEQTLHGTWYDRTRECLARKRGELKRFPSAESVHLTPLPFLDGRSLDEKHNFVVNAVQEVEQETALKHRENGTRPIGARAILRRRPHDKPEAFRPSPAPKFHAATREEYRKLRMARELTTAAYREAADRLRSGDVDVRFPVGTFPPAAPYVESRAPS